MKCPFCGKIEDKVVDSRTSPDGESIRRRRECLSCQRRFTSYEHIERAPLMVIKKDGTRQPFDRAKLLSGIMKACEKRPVEIERIEKSADTVERTLYRKFEREVPSSQIGELVMKYLHQLDDVAYVRFASVYRQFKDVSQFKEELEGLLDKRQKKSK